MQPGIGNSTCLCLTGDHILLVEDRFGLGVIELKRGVDLAAALDGLLVEFIGAALVAIEVGLEMIADVEEQVDGANGVGIGGDPLPISDCLKVQNGRSGRKDTPVH